MPGTEVSSTLHGPGLCILTTALDGGVRSPRFVTTLEQAHEGWWPPRVGDAELGLGPRSGWSAARSSKRDVCPSALLRPRVLLTALGPLPPPALLAPRSSTASGHQPLGHSRGGWDAWSPHPPAPWPRPALPGQLFKGVATWQHLPTMGCVTSSRHWSLSGHGWPGEGPSPPPRPWPPAPGPACLCPHRGELPG